MTSQRASKLHASTPDQRLIADRYRVLRLLGQGGMGAVYAVLDLTNQRELALKRLATDAKPATAALFEREYRTLAGLRHPCIVEAYEYGRDAQGPFYTMELIDGVELSQQAPMPWRDVCRDLRDIASILGLLHARQLLHRDLSPRNLLSDQSDSLVADRARRSLQVALELSSADTGFIVLADSQGEALAHLGSSTPSTDLVAWAEQSMLDASVDEQTVMTEQVHSEVDSNYKVVDTMRFCVVPLWARVEGEERVVAALVLGFDNRVPRMPDPSAMRAIALHLVAPRTQRENTQ